MFFLIFVSSFFYLILDSIPFFPPFFLFFSFFSFSFFFFFFSFLTLKYNPRGGGADLTKIQPAGIRTKSGGARSIEDGKGPAGSGLSLGVAGVENGGRKDATFLRPPW